MAKAKDTLAVDLKDLTIDNITENVHAINSKCDDRRLEFLLKQPVDLCLTYTILPAKRALAVANGWRQSES